MSFWLAQDILKWFENPDSFIEAFHTKKIVLQFAVDLQGGISSEMRFFERKKRKFKRTRNQVEFLH